MKRFFLFVLLAAAGCMPFVSRAQLRAPVDSTGRQAPLVIPKQAFEQSQPVYSHTTPQGKVYIMQPDNMSCLVPDMRKVAPMPGIKPVPQQQMPNPYYRSPRPKTRR